MLSMGLLGGLGAGLRRYRLLPTLCWAVLALCGTRSACGQLPPAAPPDSGGPFSAVGIGTGIRPISGLWHFHMGDDLAWAHPDFDDHGWEKMPADQPWGDAGHPGYWGFAWYRREIALDPAEKQHLALLLPPLGSVAEVYWNGVKAGGVGSPPPHAVWPNREQPVAVPLSSTPGARSGELAIRLWQYRPGSTEPVDSGGFQGNLQLGYRPFIEKTPQQFVEHDFRKRAVSIAILLMLLFVGASAFALWTRSRSQWLLLATALYLGASSVDSFCSLLPLTYGAAQLFIYLVVPLKDICFLCLILLLAGIPSRTGMRGARFWWRTSFTFLAFDLLAALGSIGEIQMLASNAHPFLFRVLDRSTELMSDALIFYVPALIVACFALTRLTLPRLFFLAAVSLSYALDVTNDLLDQQSTHVEWLSALLHRPLLVIYGSSLTIYSASQVLVLLAIVYAVSDQIGRRMARQRFVDAEMIAAQEIQQILVPAALEREAPGYAVASVYRPASEVGGDFFQIIPLQGDGTLIVAGDVSGKGLRAAMTVSLVVGTLRTLAEYDSSPAAVLAGLNRRLIGRTHGGFVTCCAVRIDAGGHAVFANAGHCQPYLEGREIDLPNGLPLGIVEDVHYEELHLELPRGQQLTLLSDGVVEARNRHGELYGFDRLSQLMQQRPSAEYVADTAVSFGQDDDITVLTVTRLATA